MYSPSAYDRIRTVEIEKSYLFTKRKFDYETGATTGG